MTNISRGPLQLMVLWVCGAGCEQLKKEKSRLLLLKNCTEVKLKQGNCWSSEQQEVTVLQQVFQINMGDKKAKNGKEKPLFQRDKTPQRDKLSELQHCQLQSKLRVQVTPSPKLSYRSYFKHLLCLAMLKGSEKSPSSIVLTWAQEQRNCSREHVAQHTTCAQLCSLPCKHKGLGRDMRSLGLVFNSSVYQLEKFNLKRSLTSVLICWSYLLQVKFNI